MKARAAAPAARKSRDRTARLVLPDIPPAWIDAMARGLIAAFAVVVVWVAFGVHVVGDYGTESDFYGGYAEGARLMQSGRVDFGRWPVVGPGYEFALAMLGFVTRDLFTAARILSVVSAVLVMVLWWRILHRHA